MWCTSLQQFNWCQQQTSPNLFSPFFLHPAHHWSFGHHVRALWGLCQVHPTLFPTLCPLQCIQSSCENTVPIQLWLSIFWWLKLWANECIYGGEDNSKIVKCVIIKQDEDTGDCWLVFHAKTLLKNGCTHVQCYMATLGDVVQSLLPGCSHVRHSASQSTSHQISPGPDRLTVLPVYDQLVCRFAI